VRPHADRASPRQMRGGISAPKRTIPMEGKGGALLCMGRVLTYPGGNFRRSPPPPCSVPFCPVLPLIAFGRFVVQFRANRPHVNVNEKIKVNKNINVSVSVHVSHRGPESAPRGTGEVRPAGRTVRLTPQAAIRFLGRRLRACPPPFARAVVEGIARSAERAGTTGAFRACGRGQGRCPWTPRPLKRPAKLSCGAFRRVSLQI